MSKNGSSLKLCSRVDCILWFWSKLCKSSMLHHGHFQNMKQSSKNLFHDLINSVFILFYFLSMISYRFSSQYTKVRVAYVCAILVPIAVPRVWMLFMLSNGKELLFRISSIRSVIHFLLNLGMFLGILTKTKNQILQMKWFVFLIHEDITVKVYDVKCIHQLVGISFLGYGV